MSKRICKEISLWTTSNGLTVISSKKMVRVNPDRIHRACFIMDYLHRKRGWDLDMFLGGGVGITATKVEYIGHHVGEEYGINPT